MHFQPNDIRRALQGTSAPQKKEQEAAALLPLIGRNGELFILFERRVLSLRHQPGDIALPGGGIENGETPLETALHGVREELPIDDNQFAVLGEINTENGPAGQRVYAFAAGLKDYRDTFLPAEIDRVLTLPLFFFPTHRAEHYRGSSIARPIENFPYDRIKGDKNCSFAVRDYTMPIYPDTAPLIWGMITRVLERFVKRLLDESVTV